MSVTEGLAWARILIQMGLEPDHWRVRLMRALDALADHITGHRSYRFQELLAHHAWPAYGPTEHREYD